MEENENIYNESTERATEILMGVHAKLKAMGAYGRKVPTKKDERAESLAYMAKKYGEQPINDMINMFSGE